MDYFGAQEAHASFYSGHKIRMYHVKDTILDRIEVYNPAGDLEYTRDIINGSRHEWIHLLSGRIKSRFFVLMGDHYELHEVIIPHDTGKKCSIRNLTGGI